MPRRLWLPVSLALNLILLATLLMPLHLTGAQTTNRYFPETKHSVRGTFLAYWTDHGGLSQQGYPLTEEFQEKSTQDGKTYTVQYFERAVFELHPENQPPYNVLLSQLGKYQLDSRYPNGSNPAAAPQSPPGAGGGGQPPPAGAPANLNDIDYAAYLRQKFTSVGGHPIGFAEVRLAHGGDGSNNVYFVLDSTSYLYIAQQANAGDLRTWGAGLLPELKAHWPGKFVSGELIHEFWSTDPPSGGYSECFQEGRFDASQGWLYTIIFVDTYFLAPNDTVNVCKNGVPVRP